MTRVRSLDGRGGEPLIVAHRGASGHAPGNSVRAVEIALDQGADMVEIDIRRTADGVLVVHHDRTILGLPVSFLTYEAARQRVPSLATFDEILQVVAERALLDVEVKEAGYEADIVRAATSRLPCEHLLVTSFLARVVKRVRTLEPAIRTGWITQRSNWTRIARRLSGTQADWGVVEATRVTPPLLAATREMGIPVAVWTVNAREEIEAMLRAPGVGAIITDLPDVARHLRDGLSEGARPKSESS